jgi:hypothetical protein
VRFGRQPPTAEVCLIMRPEENALYSRIWRGPAISKTGPPDGERPSAYTVVLGDMEITRSFGCDHGIAAQTMLLGAVEKGLGGCMIASIDNIERDSDRYSRYPLDLRFSRCWPWVSPGKKWS